MFVTEYWAKRLVVILSGILVVIVLSGCMGEVPTGENPPEEELPLDVVGFYDLIQANGNDVPTDVDTLPGCSGENGIGPGTVKVTRGEMELRQDGFLSIWRSWEQWCWPDQTGGRDDFTGTFQVTPDTVILNVNSGTDVLIDREIFAHATQTLSVYWETISLDRRYDLTFRKR